MADAQAEDKDRGRQADRPREIPKPGWRDILLRTWEQMGRDHVSLLAAGVAFYGLLALFPAIAVLIALWGLMFDPLIIEQQIQQITGALPEQAAALVTREARAVAQSQTGHSIAAVAGFLFAFYTATLGVRSLIEGLNIIYGERERRGFLARNLLAILLTLALMITLLITLGLIVVVPILLNAVGLDATSAALIGWLRWPLLAGMAILGLGLLYHFAPSRSRPRYQWVSWGSVIATLLWIIGSIGFSVYVRNFASYNEVYGSLGAVIILLMWFWLSAFIILMGAELNSEIEHQTARDSTIGGRQQMGERGAYVADTLGEPRS